MSAPLLELEDLAKHFPGPRPGVRVNAVNGVSLAVDAGETVALVGESGSGKSTVGRLALRLERPSGGQVRFDGRDITKSGERQLRSLRARMQMVFQDPWGTLNPRLSIGTLLEEPFLLHSTLGRGERREAAAALAERVRLDRRLLERHPVQLSGGQLQRVAIARAIATKPQLIVLDEPTSSLDLSVRAEILSLLAELKRESRASYLFISHDLGTVQRIASRIVVLYLGRVVEEGPAEEIFASPQHPYTQALFSAQLSTDPTTPPRRHRLEGDPPSPIDLPTGCSFHGRCPVALPICATKSVPLVAIDDRRKLACLRFEDGGNRLPE
jgi:oligopeptide/dipeptide ABC transporter ATP-binding protein